MVAYGLVILSFIRLVCKSHPEISQPWYTDKYGSRGDFEEITVQLDSIIERKSVHGYFPDTTNSILMISKKNIYWTREFLRVLDIHVVMRHCVLGGFLGEVKTHQGWVEATV